MIALFLVSLFNLATAAPPEVVLEYFHSRLPADASLWKTVSEESKSLSENGFAYIWLPPANKGSQGINDNGYGAYDLYDLGEFLQKGTISTKYGTKDEYLEALRNAKAAGLKIMADVVLNHRIGADATEDVLAVKVNPQLRTKWLGELHRIQAWTKFNFEGRAGKYSSFTWDARHFKGVDWDQLEQQKGNIFLFQDPLKQWNRRVSTERGNFDFLMGADIDFDSTEAREELLSWGKWYTHLTDVDGFRFDAAKHIDYEFLPRWVGALEAENQREYLSVGEFWDGQVSELRKYLKQIQHKFPLFDVPLHYRLFRASQEKEKFDLSKIFKDTLTEKEPEFAVQYVDNHDTQPGEVLQSTVGEWFKYHAYALLLLRDVGRPCVFYGDYYGASYDGKQQIPSFREWIDLLLRVRKDSVGGRRHDYFDSATLIGWTFEGDRNHRSIAVVLGNTRNGAICSKKMYVGFGGASEFQEVSGHGLPLIRRSRLGFVKFSTPCNGVAVWVQTPGFK